jgi:hypothetical protein
MQDFLDRAASLKPWATDPLFGYRALSMVADAPAVLQSLKRKFG